MGGDHKCPVCQATFTRPQHVARHMRSRKSRFIIALGLWSAPQPICTIDPSTVPHFSDFSLLPQQIRATALISASIVGISLLGGPWIWFIFADVN